MYRRIVRLERESCIVIPQGIGGVAGKVLRVFGDTAKDVCGTRSALAVTLWMASGSRWGGDLSAGRAETSA